MSLWYKQVDQITFQDVEDFCKLRQREGPRLDYKGDFPKELHNLVAAFANTLGGLIVLGVASDKTKNEPIWPPKGMLAGPSIEERIIQICRDNIYPPVRPQISMVLANPHATGTVVMVIRVDESPEAPHAVDQGRRIYERTGNQNHPYQFGHIDQIQHLLNRRQKIEEQREGYLQKAISRAGVYLAHKPGFPRRWASVTPLFPWRELCDQQACRDFHANWNHEVCSQRTHWDVQRAPGGSLAQGNIFAEGSQPIVAYSDLTSKGQVFAFEFALEFEEGLKPNAALGPSLDYSISCKFAESVLRFAKDFYQQQRVEKPGFISLSIGLSNVKGCRMFHRPGRELTYWGGKRFPDPEFRATENLLLEEFLENAQAGNRLFEQLAFGFDVLPRAGTG